MTAQRVERPAESRAVAEFLAAVLAEPSALVLEGEPGIGKTTLWLAAIEAAAGQGFRVLAARASTAESVLAYAALGDLLSGVDDAVLAGLAAPQRAALEAVLLRADGADGINQRAVAAGFLTVVRTLADASPVLLAVDDLQWIDTASRLVLGYVARRLPRNTGLLGAARTEARAPAPDSWLRLPTPEAFRRITLAPFGLAGLREVLLARLGRTFPRAVMVQIHHISGGNPFYALELARAMDDGSPLVRLPSSLTELVRARIGRIGADARNVLLAAACSAAPTVESVARAVGVDEPRVVRLLSDAVDRDIIRMDGHRICFSHPLLARGVYDDATATRRRAMHRRLAEIVDEPELQARHLAIAVGWADPQVLACLDRAAEAARLRGAPSTAAELIDMAIGLGGDSPERRLMSARNHVDAGDGDSARAILKRSSAEMTGAPRAQVLRLLGGLEILYGSYLDAADALRRALTDATDDAVLRARILTLLAFVEFNTGRRAAAAADADEAVECATRAGDRGVLSQALAMRTLVTCLLGRGFDPAALHRALELEEPGSGDLGITRTSGLHAMLLAYTGRFDAAVEVMRAVARHCRDRGEGLDLTYIALHRVLVELWRGEVRAAATIAEEAIESAAVLDGDLPRGVVLLLRQALATYAGRVDDARGDGARAAAIFARSGSAILTTLTTSLTGFLELSVGDHVAAIATLRPLLPILGPDLEGTEIITAGFLPDLVEAQVLMGLLDDAEPLVQALTRNGRRLDRPWMLAVAARCRAMMLAARGDLAGAVAAVDSALAELDRVPMRFERARTLLLLGQLRRRQRHRDAAAAALRAVLESFEDMGTTLWAERARAELGRTVANRARRALLSESELRIAQLSASGMTNRDVAAALFVSPKTVEANLTRIYRKLGIHSRAELGRVMGGDRPDDRSQDGANHRESPDAAGQSVH